MKKTTARLCWMSTVALLLVVLAAQPVLASDTDVPTPTVFGAPYAAITSLLVAAPAWTGRLDETVYFNGTIYTYVFKVSNTGPSVPPLGPQNLATSTLAFQDNFSSTLSWGVVTDPSYTSPGIDDKGDFPLLGPGFNFGTTSFQVFINQDLPQGDVFTFYAQSRLSPTLGQFSGVDGGVPGFGVSLDPGPEPSSILLFGTGITTIGLILRRRLLTS
jgi:hypothetical protein